MANFNEYHATVHFDAAEIKCFGKRRIELQSPVAAMAPAVCKKPDCEDMFFR
jgi:hypothetical protein